jgi:hypothetical protein
MCFLRGIWGTSSKISNRDTGIYQIVASPEKNSSALLLHIQDKYE